VENRQYRDDGLGRTAVLVGCTLSASKRIETYKQMQCPLYGRKRVHEKDVKHVFDGGLSRRGPEA
jgi:hypothetical protein